jgi:hypothetical protein
MMTRKRPRTTPRDHAFPARRFSRALVLACASLFLIINLLIIHPSLQGRDRPKPKDYALIFGTVWGPDDRPVPGVKVNIRRAGEKKARWEVYSNSRGEFEQHVPVGRQDYVIWADPHSYKSRGSRQLQPPSEVTVRIENNERADTGLHLK